jgi:hypothetical protein
MMSTMFWTDVSEELIASVFSVTEEANQETSRSFPSVSVGFMLCLLLDPDDRRRCSFETSGSLRTEI